MTKKILLTGGIGYIGSHICVALLEYGYEISILDSDIKNCSEIVKNISKITELNHKKFKQRISLYEGDIRDKKILREIFLKLKNKGDKFSAVIHLAGLKSVSQSIKNPLDYWDVNVNGSINLLKVMNEFCCKTIIFSSSAMVYGSKKDLKLDESLRLNPTNPYGLTKATVEKILETVFLSELDYWKVCNLRYFNPIGAHFSGLIGEKLGLNGSNIFPLLNLVASGKKKLIKIYGNDWPTKDGTGIRDYIHVMDLAYGHVIAMEYLLSNKSQQINLNIGSGQGTTVLELIKIYQRVNNCSIPYEFCERREGDVGILVADNQLAKKILNWNPTRSIEEMCKDGWNWEKNQTKLS